MVLTRRERGREGRREGRREEGEGGVARAHALALGLVPRHRAGRGERGKERETVVVVVEEEEEEGGGRRRQGWQAWELLL